MIFKSQSSRKLHRIALVATVFSFSRGMFAQTAITGIVRPLEEVSLQSEVSGVVQRIAVVESERVKQGQLLVELRNDHQRINLELSRAGLTKAKAAAEETQVMLQSAERELNRLQIAADALPRKQFEDVSDQVLRLKANLNTQLAEIARAVQDMKLREQEVKDTQLVAPFTGTVTEILIKRGDSLKPFDTPVLTLVALDELYAELLLPSRYVSSVHLQQPIKIKIEGDWMGRTGQLEGQITYINSTINAASRTFKIKVGIPASRGLVRPGMLVEATFAP